MANRRLNVWPLLGATLMLAAASLAISDAAAADRSHIEMLRMPGSSELVPMPPKAMRDKIEQRMRSGDVPRVTMADPRQIAAKCQSHGYLLGCTLDFGSIGKIIYIRKGMSRELTHFTKVHEFAHALYGWRH